VSKKVKIGWGGEWDGIDGVKLVDYITRTEADLATLKGLIKK
jgi:hypothetical protein